MKKTKLILIDGMTGSGKSVSAHFLARQLAKNGIKARWYHEEEPDHPLLYREPEEYKGLPEAERKEIYMRDYPAQWKAFADSLQGSDEVSIVECYLFQSSLIGLVRLEYPRERIKAFSRGLVDQVRGLDPVIISLYQEDVPKALRLNWSRRGKDWMDWYVDRMAKTSWAVKRGIGGAEASYGIWESWMSMTRELVAEFGVPYLAIENSAQDWAGYRASMLEFLGVPFVAETLARPADSRFAGLYMGKGDEGEDAPFNVRAEADGLRVDAFWPDLRLLPKTDTEFEMEGFPFSFRFNLDSGGVPVSLEVSEATFAFEKGWTALRQA